MSRWPECPRCGEELTPVTDMDAYECGRCGVVKSGAEAHQELGVGG